MTNEFHDDGLDDIDDEIFRMRCAACKNVIGLGTKASAQQIATDHSMVCPASPEEYQQAIVDMKFSQIINKMLEEDEGWGELEGE